MLLAWVTKGVVHEFYKHLSRSIFWLLKGLWSVSLEFLCTE